MKVLTPSLRAKTALNKLAVKRKFRRAWKLRKDKKIISIVNDRCTGESTQKNANVFRRIMFEAKLLV
ncbi:MAG: hypothetical protein Q7U63_10135 [Polaromonas sp.]|uniref:hypothetical protein n=1 Tax=Polaromonas sp. TaxID=1869339 RepID=UPI002728E2E9|nr:hypothetical protein [Polaromonas sp.]MDO9114141.1 hypothetical protein [Polaromonas sp.]MDP1885623.1 hypothetical protein [Polaromonas sp.]MDP3222658.1 hypothetical protein [Rubrivivax sp.]